MGMTPSHFFEAFVEGNCTDYMDHPGCVRRAFNVAVSASHLADHYFEFYKRTDPGRVATFASLGEFVAHVDASTSGAFKDMRSIANAYKHLYTFATGKRAAECSVSSAGSIEAIEFDGEDLEYVAKEYEHVPAADSLAGSYVAVKKKDGTVLRFEVILQPVMDYWHTAI